MTHGNKEYITLQVIYSNSCICPANILSNIKFLWMISELLNVGQRLVIIHHFPFLFLGLIRRQAGLACQSFFGKFYYNMLWILQPTISFPHFVIIVQKFPNFWEAYIILLSSLSLRFCLRNCRSLSNDQALCFLHLHIISDQFATSTGQVHPYRHQQYIYKLLP